MILCTDTLAIDKNILKDEKFTHVVYIGNELFANDLIQETLVDFVLYGNVSNIYQFTESIYPWENLLQWHKQNGFPEFKLYSYQPDAYGYYVNPNRQIFPPSDKYWNASFGPDDVSNTI